MSSPTSQDLCETTGMESKRNTLKWDILNFQKLPSKLYFSNEDRQELLDRINRKIELTLDDDDLDMESSKRSSVILAQSAQSWLRFLPWYHMAEKKR